MVQPTSTQSVDEIIPTSRVAPVKQLPSIVIAKPSIVEATTIDSSERSAEKPASDSSSSSRSDDASDSASIVTATPSLVEPTTFYTTYTFYTTEYIGDSTRLKSRFETVTNVVRPTPTEVIATPVTVAPVGRAINLDNVNSNQIANAPKSGRKGAKEKFAEKQQQSNEPIISINAGKIVDAEGISSTYEKY